MSQTIIDLSKIINLPNGKYLSPRATADWAASQAKYAYESEATTDLKSFLNGVFSGQPKPDLTINGFRYTKQAQQLAKALNQIETCYGYGSDWGKAYKNAAEKLCTRFKKLAPNQYSNFNAYKWAYLGPVDNLEFTKIKFPNGCLMYFIWK